MPRQRGGGSAPRRPTPAAPPRPAQAPQQTRSASTAAHPPAQQQAPAQSGGPGLFGQMASTAAGVAVGSSIGHAIGGFFGGGSSAPAETQSNLPADQYNTSGATTNYQSAAPCARDVDNFRTCMDQNQGNLTICGWYLDQLKACQQAASQY